MVKVLFSVAAVIVLYCIVLQGDLKTYLRSHRSDLDSIDKQGLLLNIAYDMASGLQAMHHCNYVHR